VINIPNFQKQGPFEILTNFFPDFKWFGFQILCSSVQAGLNPLKTGSEIEQLSENQTIQHSGHFGPFK
jgi:hypothetical protein